MNTGKRPHQAYAENDVEGDEQDTDSDVPLRETQAKRLKHTQKPNAERVVSPPPLQPSQPAPVPQAQPATQPSVTAIRPEQTQSHGGPRPRALTRPLRTLVPATAKPIDAGNSNPLQPCWPPLPDNDNIAQPLLSYAEQICTVLNSLCGTSVGSEAFFELIRHQDTAPSARPVWTVPEISEQIEIGFVCAYPDRYDYIQMCEHCPACEPLHVTHRITFRSSFQVDPTFFCVTREGNLGQHSMLSLFRHKYRDQEYVKRRAQDLLLQAHKSALGFCWRLAAWAFKDGFYGTDKMDIQTLVRLFEDAVPH